MRLPHRNNHGLRRPLDQSLGDTSGWGERIRRFYRYWASTQVEKNRNFARWFVRLRCEGHWDRQPVSVHGDVETELEALALHLRNHHNVLGARWILFFLYQSCDPRWIAQYLDQRSITARWFVRCPSSCWGHSSICRTMLNYGFDDLRLDDGETRARAKHASRVLDTLSVHETIESATEDCSVVVGTSGKREVGEKRCSGTISFHGTWSTVSLTTVVERPLCLAKRARVFPRKNSGSVISTCDPSHMGGLPNRKSKPRRWCDCLRDASRQSSGQSGDGPWPARHRSFENVAGPAVRSALVRAIDQFVDGSDRSHRTTGFRGTDAEANVAQRFPVQRRMHANDRRPRRGGISDGVRKRR